MCLLACLGCTQAIRLESRQLIHSVAIRCPLSRNCCYFLIRETIRLSRSQPTAIDVRLGVFGALCVCERAISVQRSNCVNQAPVRALRRVSRARRSEAMPRLRSWTVLAGSLAGIAVAALFLRIRSKKKATKVSMQTEADKSEFHRQLEEATRLREFAHSIAEGKHHGNFERKDYIAFAMFSRCLQTHEAAELVVKQSLIDEVWVLVRALVEYAVNAVYMLYVADAATADNFNDYQDYLAYKVLLDLKGTDEPMLRTLVSVEEEEKARLRFEKIRGKFDDKRGDKWCADDALYKRAAKVDAAVSKQAGEKRTDLLWLVNTLWRYASGYTHGTAGSLSDHLEEKGEEVWVKRKPTYAEAAKAMQSANSALYQVLLPIDVQLGGKNAAELNRRFNAWVGVR